MSELSNTTLETSVLSTFIDDNKSYYKYRNRVSNDTFTGRNASLFSKVSELLDRHELVTFKAITAIDVNFAYIFGSTGVNSDYELESYIDQLVRFERLRKQHRAASKLLSNIKPNSDPTDLQDKLFSDIGDSRNRTERSNVQILSDLSNRVAKGNGMIGIDTGFKSLNDFTGGFNASNLIILAARPSQGKTAEALSVMVNLAKQGVKVLYFNIEMDDTELMARIVAIHHSVHLGDILRGNIKTDDWNAKYLNGMDFLSNIEIVSDLIKLSDMTSEAHYKHSLGQADLVIFDYLQLIQGDRTSNREREIASISLGCKRLAKRLKIPVILLSQLSREVEKRPDKVPRLSDLRESGAIEQDADVVIFAYRPEYYGFEEFNGESSKGVMINLISKNRNGATGECVLSFKASYTRVQEKSSESDYREHGAFTGISEGFDPEF